LAKTLRFTPRICQKQLTPLPSLSKAQSFTPRFRQRHSIQSENAQCSGLLRVSSDNGKYLKSTNIWVNLKKIVENVGYTILVFING
jgi:hypothetical protein